MTKSRFAAIRPLWQGLIALMLALFIVCSQGRPVAAQTSTGADLVAIVNNFRVAHGLPALTPHPALMAAAQRQADWIAATQHSSHVGEGGTMPQDRAAAAGYPGFVLENVAEGTVGYASPAWAVEQGWANSYGHRYAMLSDAIHIGGGVAADSENEHYVLLVGRLGSYFPPPPGIDTGQAPVDAAEADSEPASEEESAAPVPAEIPVAVPITLAEPDANGNVVHVVQVGQTAWGIAASYDVALEELLVLNELQESAILKPGDRVWVRLGEGQVVPPTRMPQQQVIVQAGQTIWEIAATHGLTVDELLGFNGLTRADPVHPGDALWLCPPAQATAAALALSPSPSATLPAPTSPVSTATPDTATATAQPATAQPTPSPDPTTPVPPPSESEADSGAGLVQGVLIAIVAISLIALTLIGIGLALWPAPGHRSP